MANKFKVGLLEKNIRQHLKALKDMRNIIAHHDRLFNTNKLIKISNFDGMTQFESSEPKAYFDLILFYLKIIAPQNTFDEKLSALTCRYVSTYGICLSHWGF